MEYVIGIDGGGTKTEVLMADDDGIIVAKSSGGSTNPNILATDELFQTLEALLTDLSQQAPGQFNSVTHLFAGISGAGEENNQDKVKRILTDLLPKDISIEVFPDTINALYSGTFGKPGIVQIAGTGSITYGINNDLRHERVGGWGYLFGDEGSGYDIGKQGIIAALKAVDGRGKETVLLEMLYDHFGVTNGQELIKEVYSSSTPKNKIAPVSKIVFKAYKQHDLVANAIITNAVKEITHSIRTLYAKLFYKEENALLVLCGGVFNDQDILPPLIKKDLATSKESLSLVIPEIPPVGGSLIGAYLSKNNGLDKNILDNVVKMNLEGR
ncbi:hypothetical protein LG329_05700 [Virgibacillus necropolis]|uniref:N-acetylglucosamine kinase n=1 Tax=Virgibacillus necropolis TaxID=163877 RepID=UPI00384E2295